MTYKEKRAYKKAIKEKNKKQYEEISKKNTAKNPIKTLFRLLGFLKLEKTLFIVGFIISVITTILGIGANLLLKPIIDEITSGNIDGFINNIYIYAVVGVAATLLGFTGSTTLAIMAQKVVFKIRKKLFDHMESLSIEYFDNNQSGDIMSVYSNDVELLSTALDQSITKIIIAIMQITITMGILIYLNWILALAIFVLITLYSIGVIFLGNKTNKHSKLKQHRIGNMNAYSEEMLTGMQTVKVFNHEKNNIEEFTNRADQLQNSSIKTSFYGISAHALSGFFNGLLFGIIGITGGLLQVKGYITLGMIVVYIQFVRNLSYPIETMANQFATLVTSLAGAERIFAILDSKPEIDEGHVKIECRDNKKYWNDNGNLIEAKGFVEFKDVDFSYNNKDLALEGISLYAKPGQKIAFVGSTGAGKTTVTNLVNRFYEIKGGEILIDGINIQNIRKQDLRENITTVLQDTTLFTGTIKENIKYGNIDATDEEAEKAAKISNAHCFIENLPDKYDTLINPDDISLSQGEMQLLSIARAAVSSPLILILDEATSSIDTNTERLVQNGLDNLMKKFTTLVIAHRLSTVQNSNAIMVIDQGRIIERGDHDDLLLQKGKYYNLYTGKDVLV